MTANEHSASSHGPIKVLVVDDSALVRQTLGNLLSEDPQIKVIGLAGDPYIAARKMEDEIPDVILLDVEMPRMDGLTFLRKIMHQHPIPTVICSTLVDDGSDAAQRAWDYGAVDVITKPKVGTRAFLEESRIRICDTVKAAAKANLKALTRTMQVTPALSADVIIPPARTARSDGSGKPAGISGLTTTEKVVAVGASTGGTEALRVFLQAMPLNCPGILVVQHMPEKFTAAFAARLDSICRITVREAQGGETVLRGQALIAPGNRHMLLKRSGARYFVEVRDGPLVRRHRPSVDVLYRSAARYGGKNVIGVIMTGMGDDGAQGLAELHDTGAATIAQDEATCVVFGMPGEAVRRGAVDQVLPLTSIATEVLRLVG